MSNGCFTLAGIGTCLQVSIVLAILFIVMLAAIAAIVVLVVLIRKARQDGYGLKIYQKTEEEMALEAAEQGQGEPVETNESEVLVSKPQPNKWVVVVVLLLAGLIAFGSCAFAVVITFSERAAGG